MGYIYKAKKILALIRSKVRVVVGWWLAQDRRYGLKWRVANVFFVFLMLISAATPMLTQVLQGGRYRLSSEALQLVGEANSALSSKLSYDTENQVYQFNKEAVKEYSPLAALKSNVGGESKDSKSLYALDVAQDLKKGVTYHDVNSQLSFSMIPEFGGMSGRLEQGRLVFPIGAAQMVYTLKNNGLKEDIVVQKTTKDAMTFSYRLDLPKTLEARVIPNSDGNIGIYSADPVLFNNISFGSDADKASVQKVRENSAKTHLVFGLPAPVINTLGNTPLDGASARFQLSGNRLSVITEGLSNLKGSFSIDPSVTVTSTTDFQTAGNNEDNIDFSTAGQIGRTGLTGGSVPSWTTDGGFNPSFYGQSAVAYNGYLYLLGGYETINGVRNAVLYGTINSDGSIGTLASTASFTTSRTSLASVAYNGYLYVIGGCTAWSGTSCTADAADVQYALICTGSNSGVGGCGATAGTVGTWTATTSFTTARSGHTSVAYDGNMYVLGGYDGTSYLNGVQYAPINADGTVGSWTSTTAFTTTRFDHTSVVYNGFIYVIGGSNNGTLLSDVQYAPINSDGTIGTWATTTAFTTARFGHSTVMYNGYLYVMGGCSVGNCTTYLNDVQYAPINSDGTIGTWATTTAFTTARFLHSSVAYNGYVYVMDGSNGSALGTILYAKVDPAGTATAYTVSGNTLATATRGNQTVAYNGFLYVMGGDNAGAPITTIYAAAIAADGSIGAFSTTGMTALPAARTLFGAVAYNGYMFISGGCTVNYSGGTCTTAANDLATVYSAPITAGTGAIGTWTAQTSFTTARYGHSMVVNNGYVYIMGGLNGSTYQSDIQYHALGASGAISGAWSTSAQTLPASQAMFGAAVNGGKLYVAGGCTAGPTTCTTTVTTVAYATFSGTGDLSGAFTTTSSFTTARGNLGLVVVNGYLYITGGRTNTTFYSDTQFAPINTDGSVGTWAGSSASVLSTARWGFGCAAYKGVIYVATGRDSGGGYVNNVNYAQVNNGGDGDMGSTWQSGTSFTSFGGRIGHSSVAYNGYLYILGGCSAGVCTGLLNDVDYIPISSGGAISGTWQSTSSFITARYEHTAFVYNGYMYVLGGCSAGACTNYLSDVQYAPVNSDGTLGAWHYTHNSTDDGTSLVSGFSTGRYYHTTAAYNGYVYVLGGFSGAYQNDVQYAPLNSNGTVGTWASTSSFTTARFGHTTVVYNGYIYVIGGKSSAVFQNDVQYAPLNSNGTVGTWLVTTSFLTGRDVFAAVAHNGYLYIMGGCGAGTCSSYLSDVQYAPLNSNGTLGTWVTSTSLTSARDYIAAVAYNGFVYVTGGYIGSGGYLSTAIYNSLNAIPRVAHYSKLIDLGAIYTVNTITYSGLPANSTTAISYKAAGSNGIFGSQSLAANIGGVPGSGCLGNAQNTRYILVAIAIDDSLGQGSGGAFPDINGTNANVTDLTVAYYPSHAPPNIRLRAGQTLQDGLLSPLDTCGV